MTNRDRLVVGLMFWIVSIYFGALSIVFGGWMFVTIQWITLALACVFIWRWAYRKGRGDE